MITSKDIETLIKISQTTKTQDQMSSLQVSINIQRRFNFYFQNIFLKKLKRRETYQTYFWSSITLVPKPDRQYKK